MGKVIAVTNQKGGVGKTTTCVNLSACLGARGFRVLLIDIDPQGNSTQGLGVSKQKVQKSTYDIFVDGLAAEKVLTHTAFKNVDLLPTNNALIGAEIEMVEISEREFRLKRSLATLRAQYDFCLLYTSIYVLFAQRRKMERRNPGDSRRFCVRYAASRRSADKILLRFTAVLHSECAGNQCRNDRKRTTWS